MAITKAERGELRSIVKQQFRVLRSEVDQREAEMGAEVEERLTSRYVDSDKRRLQVEGDITAIVAEAQAKIDAIWQAQGDEIDSESRAYMGRPELRVPTPPWRTADRAQFRRALQAEVEAITANAKAQLQRQEADLLRNLAVGAIESTEAKGFLDGIPTVAELVPSQRLAELEKAFVDDPQALEP